MKNHLIALGLLAALPFTSHAQAAVPEAPIMQAGQWDGCPYYPLENGKFLMRGNKLVTLSKECESPQHPYGVVVSAGPGVTRTIYIREGDKSFICTLSVSNAANSRCLPANGFNPQPFEHKVPRYDMKLVNKRVPISSPESLACMAKSGFTESTWRSYQATPVQTVAYRKCLVGIVENDIPQPPETSPASPVPVVSPSLQPVAAASTTTP